MLLWKVNIQSVYTDLQFGWTQYVHSSLRVVYYKQTNVAVDWVNLICSPHYNITHLMYVYRQLVTHFPIIIRNYKTIILHTKSATFVLTWNITSIHQS